MANAVRSLGGSTVVLVLLCLAPVALAQSEKLEEARDLVAQRDYESAQALLLEIDTSTLTEEEKAEYQELLEYVPRAIQGARRAAQDEADAQAAYDEGRWEDAERLYGAVSDNVFATPSAREQANMQLLRIEEKKQLAEAAQPSGPVEPASPEQPGEPQPEEAEGETAEPPATQQQEAPPAPPAPQVVEGPGRMTMVDRLRRRDALLWQRALAKLQEAAELVDAAIAQENFDEARKLAEQAIQVIESSRAYAYPPSAYEDARRRALELRDHVQQEFDAAMMRRAEQQREEIRRQIDERRERQEQLRLETVEQLFNTARQLEREHRFDEAAEAMRQLLALDPANDKARLALSIYEEMASLEQQKEVARDIARTRRQTFVDAEETLIPWPHDVLYPKNWPEISARRDGLQQSTSLSDEEFELNRKLEERQPEISFAEQPFDQVVDFLTDLNRMNISVDWEDLDLNGIDRDKPVSVKLQDVKLRTVLEEVLAQVGGDVRLAFSVGDGLLRIATKEKLDRNKFILVYDIRDLLVRIERFTNAPRIDLSMRTSDSAKSNRTVFGETGSSRDDEDAELKDDDGQVEEILDIIRTTVAPDSWRETGGGDGALRELNGQLIVFNTSDAHRQIRDLLGQLRSQRALMIGVEARFLTVASNFLEEIGVDIDFVFNNGNAGFDPAFNQQGQGLFDPFTGSPILVPRPFSRAGVFPATPAFGQPFTVGANPVQPYQQAGFVPGTGSFLGNSGSNLTPVPVQQGSINLTDPTNLNTGIPGSISQAANFGPAISIAGSFLDNLQVDFLIRATQANKRSSVVQAPRLMLFNGQRAWVAVTRDRSYVSSVQPQVAEGAAAVQPVVAQINSGNTLDVEGTISADRKYVTLTIRVGFAREPTFERFEVQRASGNSPGIFVTLPDQERQAINTTVSVPDGGTVLIGGLKQVGEIEIDAGVPILSKIPVLKRAFTNTSMVKDTQTLLILLKAKILIQQEAEEEAFPTLTRG